MSKQTKKYAYQSGKKWKDFEIEIRLSTDFKLYFQGKDIPPELCDPSDLVRPKKYEDFRQLNDDIMEMISRHEEKSIEETKERVIIYDLTVNDEDGLAGLAIKFDVLQKITTSRKGKKESSYFVERSLRGSRTGKAGQMVLDDFNVYQKYASGNGRHERFDEMPWTATRERWFQDMADSIIKLSERIKDGIGRKPELLSQRIDSGAMEILLLEES